MKDSSFSPSLGSKKFSRTIEDFTCEVCQTRVKGDGYTNHCPHCLHSKHVDINPGDRASACQGVMRPIAVGHTNKKGDYITHKCLKCGLEKNNKLVETDSRSTFREIARQQVFPT